MAPEGGWILAGLFFFPLSKTPHTDFYKRYRDVQSNTSDQALCR